MKRSYKISNSYILCFSLSVSVVEEPLGKELNWVLWLCLISACKALGDDHTDLILHKVLDVGVLISHNLGSDFIAAHI